MYALFSNKICIRKAKQCRVDSDYQYPWCLSGYRKLTNVTKNLRTRKFPNHFRPWPNRNQYYFRQRYHNLQTIDHKLIIMLFLVCRLSHSVMIQKNHKILLTAAIKPISTDPNSTPKNALIQARKSSLSTFHI